MHAYISFDTRDIFGQRDDVCKISTHTVFTLIYLFSSWIIMRLIILQVIMSINAINIWIVNLIEDTLTEQKK